MCSVFLFSQYLFLLKGAGDFSMAKTEFVIVPEQEEKLHSDYRLHVGDVATILTKDNHYYMGMVVEITDSECILEGVLRNNGLVAVSYGNPVKNMSLNISDIKDANVY